MCTSLEYTEQAAGSALLSVVSYTESACAAKRISRGEKAVTEALFGAEGLQQN